MLSQSYTFTRALFTSCSFIQAGHQPQVLKWSCPLYSIFSNMSVSEWDICHKWYIPATAQCTRWDLATQPPVNWGMISRGQALMLNDRVEVRALCGRVMFSKLTHLTAKQRSVFCQSTEHVPTCSCPWEHPAGTKCHVLSYCKGGTLSQ